MILHVVLFTPRANLRPDERQAFAAVLDQALGTISSIVRYRIGRRLRTGAAYDALSDRFDYCGVIEFADAGGLAAYLSHPAHAELGRLFYTASADTFAADYEAVESSPAAAVERWIEAP